MRALSKYAPTSYLDCLGYIPLGVSVLIHALFILPHVLVAAFYSFVYLLSLLSVANSHDLVVCFAHLGCAVLGLISLVAMLNSCRLTEKLKASTVSCWTNMLAALALCLPINALFPLYLWPRCLEMPLPTRIRVILAAMTVGICLLAIVLLELAARWRVSYLKQHEAAMESAVNWVKDLMNAKEPNGESGDSPFLAASTERTNDDYQAYRDHCLAHRIPFLAANEFLYTVQAKRKEFLAKEEAAKWSLFLQWIRSCAPQRMEIVPPFAVYAGYVSRHDGKLLEQERFSRDSERVMQYHSIKSAEQYATAHDLTEETADTYYASYRDECEERDWCCLPREHFPKIPHMLSNATLEIKDPCPQCGGSPRTSESLVPCVCGACRGSGKTFVRGGITGYHHVRNPWQPEVFERIPSRVEDHYEACPVCGGSGRGFRREVKHCPGCGGRGTVSRLVKGVDYVRIYPHCLRWDTGQ